MTYFDLSDQAGVVKLIGCPSGDRGDVHAGIEFYVR